MKTPHYLQQAVEYLDNWFDCQNIMAPQTAGYAIAIAYQGQVIYKNAFGYANIAAETSMTNDHLFRVASHSKTFTAVAIMQLMHQGKLKLSDPAALYLPFLVENPDKRLSQITIEQMLCHVSGIWRDGADPSYWQLERPFPARDEMIDFFRTQPLVIEPENCFKYSNFAYGLLGWIIEECSGMSYTTYMQEHILTPLALDKIGGEYKADTGPYATGYTAITPHGEQIPLNPTIETNKMAGATGFYANAEDLCCFYAAIMPGSGALLPDDLKCQMLQQKCAVPNEGNRGYALGFACETIGSRELRGHKGVMPGHMSKTLCDQTDGIVISILCNSHTGIPDILQSGAWHIIDFFKAHCQSPSPLQRYAGRFYDIWQISDYVAAGDKIYVANPNMYEPFTNCLTLEHKKGDTFQITDGSGYGDYMQDVAFIMDNDKATKVMHAGYPKYNKAGYLHYLDVLEKSQ